MKSTATKIRLTFDELGKPELTLTLDLPHKEAIAAATELKVILANNKTLTAEITQTKRKRSLDANAYMWVLLSKMAAALHTTKDELYLQMLECYGVFTHIVVKPNIADRVKQEWRTVRELGEVKINGQTGVQLQCYFGSHTYDTKEFSVLLDGVLSEAKEIGIEIISENEKNLLLSEWGK